jgi:hypothetical protein
MAFTRFRDDPCKINIQNQQSTDQGRWVLNTPGNGDSPFFMSDPNIISQKWGGNLWSNAIDVQSYLLGMNKRIGKDCLGKEKMDQHFPNINSSPNQYSVSRDLTTEQSRAIAPSWTVRDMQQVHFNDLPLDPQENTTMRFPNNLSTRILEKDYFSTKNQYTNN